jgi:hypothetical protein
MPFVIRNFGEAFVAAIRRAGAGPIHSCSHTLHVIAKYADVY